eukprot:SAG11_NODE_16073_length_557_cov_1.687773_1_plen_87_part_10
MNGILWMTQRNPHPIANRCPIVLNVYTQPVLPVWPTFELERVLGSRLVDKLLVRRAGRVAGGGEYHTTCAACLEDSTRRRDIIELEW